MLEAIESLPLAAAIRGSVWAYPALEIVHIAGFAALVGSLLTLELRVLGAQADIALTPLGRLSIRVALSGFIAALLAGVPMFISAASEFGRHPVFLTKMALIAAAGVNAALFHMRGSLHLRDAVAKIQAVVSMVLWLFVICAGRLIAYL